MPRKAMVTRTIETTKVVAFCADITTQQPYTAEYILSGTFEDEKNLMKALKKVVDDDTHRAISTVEKYFIILLHIITSQKKKHP